MIRVVAALLLIVFGSSLAQVAAPATPDAVAQFIHSAQLEVILAAPVLRVPEVADALRRAVVERGVSVKILTGDSSLGDGASFWWGLQRAGADLRLVREVRGYELFIDGSTRLSGDLIGRVLSPNEGAEVTLERDATVSARADRLRSIWAKARVNRLP